MSFLDNIEDHNIYNEVYLPEFKELENDITDKILDKIGGNPFFTINEEWPIYKQYPMTFICQLRDPRKNDNILYRIFLVLDNDEKYYDINDKKYYHISKIELNEINIKNKIILEKPNNYITNFKPFEIIKWNISKEFINYDDLYNILNISIEKTDDFDIFYYSHPCSKLYSFKVGGTPQTCQLNTDVNFKLNHFLQFSSFTYLPLPKFNNGIFNININGFIDYDC